MRSSNFENDNPFFPGLRARGRGPDAPPGEFKHKSHFLGGYIHKIPLSFQALTFPCFLLRPYGAAVRESGHAFRLFEKLRLLTPLFVWSVNSSGGGLAVRL